MRRELLGAGTKVALVRLVGMGAGFGLTVVLARTLGPGGLGAYAYALTLLALAVVPVNNGWATILLRETSKSQATPVWPRVRGMIVWGGRLAVMFSAFALITGLIISFATGSTAYPPGIVALLALVMVFDQISGLRLAVLRGLNFPVWGQVPEMLLRPALILAVFLLVTGLKSGTATVWDAFMALLIASMLTTLFGIGILRRKAPKELSTSASESHPKQWIKSAALLAGNAWLVILNSQIDFLMLGALSTADQLGYYKVAVQISLLSGMAYAALNMIAMQRFATLLSGGKIKELQASATFMARVAFVTTLPLPIVFWFKGEQILSLVFGPEYMVANTALLWLLALQSANAFLGFSRTMIVMAHEERQIGWVTVASVLMNLVLCTILIPRYQLEGAAISAVVSIAIWNLILWLKCFSLLRVDSSVLGLKER